MDLEPPRLHLSRTARIATPTCAPCARRTRFTRPAPAGWLRESSVIARLPADERENLLEAARRRIAEPAWHTWLTGLHRCTYVPQDLWYPGGDPTQAAAAIEYRDRIAE